MTSSPGESCELWPRAASLASLPARRSRHAAPARSHALAKVVRATLRSSDETIVVSVHLSRITLTFQDKKQKENMISLLWLYELPFCVIYFAFGYHLYNLLSLLFSTSYNIFFALKSSLCRL